MSSSLEVSTDLLPMSYEQLKEQGIEVPERLKYYPYWATYDIEVMLVSQQDLNNTEKLEWAQKHVPPSVSICSNVPEFTEPVCSIVTAIPRSCWLRWWSTLRVSAPRLRPILWKFPRWRRFSNSSSRSWRNKRRKRRQRRRRRRRTTTTTTMTTKGLPLRKNSCLPCSNWKPNWNGTFGPASCRWV